MASCAVIKFIHTANPLMSMTPQEKQEIKNKANKATIEYFKKEKNIDVTITDTEFSSELGGLKLFVNGYISNDKTKTFSVVVSSTNDYEVRELSSP